MPVPRSVQTVLDVIYGLSGNPEPDVFVMRNSLSQNKPFSPKYFQRALQLELCAIGIPGTWKGKGTAPADYVNEQKRRNITFHGLRHTFVTLSRLAGITDIEIQALAGHKSGAMMERYSHASQVLDFKTTREKLEKAVGG